MRLDHFVVHTESNSAKLLRFKETIAPLGYPFEPTNGKGTNGFRTALLHMGMQYIEIVWLLTRDGGGWPGEWVKAYNEGYRGIFCLFVQSEELEVIRTGLISRGLRVNIERPSHDGYKFPWEYLRLPFVPGTNMEMSFIRYDAGFHEKYKQFMVPNASSNGIEGILHVDVLLPQWREGIEFIGKIFPDVQQGPEDARSVDLGEGRIRFLDGRGAPLAVRGKASATDKRYVGKSFSFENLTVETVATYSSFPT